ncbi:hypothetical protein N8Z08_02215 [bacterium]|nr:hypothetical protein [bacterium]MDC1390306.1 hypothetical protein [Acidimicrobiales bacterium]
MADIVDDVDDIGSQHGVFAFGLVQVVKTLPEFTHAAKLLEGD